LNLPDDLLRMIATRLRDVEGGGDTLLPLASTCGHLRALVTPKVRLAHWVLSTPASVPYGPGGDAGRHTGLRRSGGGAGVGAPAAAPGPRVVATDGGASTAVVHWQDDPVAAAHQAYVVLAALSPVPLASVEGGPDRGGGYGNGGAAGGGGDGGGGGAGGGADGGGEDGDGDWVPLVDTGTMVLDMCADDAHAAAALAAQVPAVRRLQTASHPRLTAAKTSLARITPAGVAAARITLGGDASTVEDLLVYAAALPALRRAAATHVAVVGPAVALLLGVRLSSVPLAHLELAFPVAAPSAVMLEAVRQVLRTHAGSLRSLSIHTGVASWAAGGGAPEVLSTALAACPVPCAALTSFSFYGRFHREAAGPLAAAFPALQRLTVGGGVRPGCFDDLAWPRLPALRQLVVRDVPPTSVLPSLRQLLFGRALQELLLPDVTAVFGRRQLLLLASTVVACVALPTHLALTTCPPSLARVCTPPTGADVDTLHVLTLYCASVPLEDGDEFVGAPSASDSDSDDGEGAAAAGRAGDGAPVGCLARLTGVCYLRVFHFTLAGAFLTRTGAFAAGPALRSLLVAFSTRGNGAAVLAALAAMPAAARGRLTEVSILRTGPIAPSSGAALRLLTGVEVLTVGVPPLPMVGGGRAEAEARAAAAVAEMRAWMEEVVAPPARVVVDTFFKSDAGV